MDATHPLQHARPEPQAHAAELIICNGRQKGSRRPVDQPLLIIGRAPGCDLRLNVEGVSALHCALVSGPDGLLLRVLQSVGGTLVNGEPTAGCSLRHDDVVSVGPFQFQVKVTGPTPVQKLAEVVARHAQEKDALRIQAAAVAAQQAALAEEEAKLEQRRAALQQQQEQLGSHLEDKRRKLVEARDQARAAHAALKNDQAAHEAKVKQQRQEIEAGRRELDAGKTQLEEERERVSQMHKQLKRRWEKQWQDEQAAIKRREDDVTRQRRQVEEEREKLHQQRELLNQARLRFNGEAEVNRRQLQADLAAFRQEQHQERDQRERDFLELRQRTQAIDEREAALTQAEHDFEEHKQHWQDVQLQLEREVEGLENRGRNFRRKLADMERELVTLQARRVEAAQAAFAAEVAPATPAEGAAPAGLPEAAVVDLSDSAEQRAPLLAPDAPAAPAPVVVIKHVPVPADDGLVQERLHHLEKLSGELADQRLHLVEQCQRMVEAQERWQEERDAAADDLETLGRALDARDRECQQRADALRAAELRQLQLHEQAQATQRHLEAWQSRLTARETAWEGERDRILADVQARGKQSEQRLLAITQLHEKWQRRRRREVEWLQGERTAYAKLRYECAQLRKEFVRRSALLEKEQRELAERALAIEQFQEECISKAAQPAGAARKIDRLRRRWAALAVDAEKGLAVQRQALDKQAAELEGYHARLKEQADKLTTQEAELARQLSAWEQTRLLTEDEHGRLKNELHVSQIQRDRYEKQAHELHDEVERLARLLLDEPAPLAAIARYLTGQPGLKKIRCWDSVPFPPMPSSLTRRPAMSANENHDCPECADFDRRDFMRVLGGSALALGGLTVPAVARAADDTKAAKPAKPAEALIKELYSTFSDDQKKDLVQPYTNNARLGMYNSALMGKTIGKSYTKPQQELLEQIVKAISSGDEGYHKISREGKWDASGSFQNCGALLFGEPKDNEKYAWVFTGHHLTVRCDGNSEEGAAFGGPMYYGHTPNGYSPNNVWFYQTKSVVSVFDMLDGAQRKKAVVSGSPGEQAASVKFRKNPEEMPGILYADLSADQKKLVETVMRDVLSPYRKEDADEVMEIVKKNGGMEKIHLAFYQDKDMADSKQGHFWRLEGPGFVWNYRVLPHVHTFVNISSKLG